METAEVIATVSIAMAEVKVVTAVAVPRAAARIALAAVVMARAAVVMARVATVMTKMALAAVGPAPQKATVATAAARAVARRTHTPDHTLLRK